VPAGHACLGIDLGRGRGQTPPCSGGRRDDARYRWISRLLLGDELGNEAWDVVLLSQLVHHFTDEQNLYFAATSRSGTWPLETMQAWQRDAGLAVENAIYLRAWPGAAMAVGRKPPGRGAIGETTD